MPNEPKTTAEEQALMQAAAAYSSLNGKINTLQGQLHEALVALEGRNERIKVLDQALLDQQQNHALDLATARNNMEVYRQQRDEALLERDQLRVVFASFKAQLDAVELPLPAPPVKNGKRKRSEPSLPSMTNGVDPFEGHPAEGGLGTIPL